MLKKLALGVIIALVALAAVVFGGGLLLDRTIVVNAEQRLKTPPDRLLPLLTSTKGLSAWLKHFPDASSFVVKQRSASTAGTDEGVGLVVTFESQDGQVFETWTVREVQAPTRVVYDVDFAGIMTTQRIIELTPGSLEGCDARWNETADVASPLDRWLMFLMMDLDQIVENRNIALRGLDTAAAL